MHYRSITRICCLTIALSGAVSADTFAANAVLQKDVTVMAQPARLYGPDAFANKAPAKMTAVLLLGGSEGQLLMADDIGPQLAKLGYMSLGLRYHDGWAGSRKLANVPIESFTHAVEWLLANAGVKRVVVVGDSRGSEAALLTGIHAKRIAGVAAFVPSAYVWSAVGSADAKGPSAWTLQGKPLTFVPPIKDGLKRPQDYLDALAVGSTSALKDIEAATLPIEKIRAPLLILGTDDDAIWPSGEMARRIETRLKRQKFSYPIVVRSYANAGHRLLGTSPSAPSETYTWEGKPFTSNYGGTAAGNLAARTAAWAELEKFLKMIDSAGETTSLVVEPTVAK